MVVHPRHSRALAALKGLCASLVALLCVLLVLEVVLRTTHLFGARLAWAEPDDRIVYRFTPGRYYWQFKENDHPVSGKINSWGWRDRERVLDRPPGVSRVCFLGDSMLAAFEVEADSTFVAIAEDELNGRGHTPVEILNLGLPGATQTEELLVLQSDVAKFSPDVVAVYFNPGNDIDDVARETRGPLRAYFLVNEDGTLRLDTSFTRTRQYRTRKAINTWKQRSAVVSLVAERYNLLARARRLGAREAGSRGFPRHLRLCTAGGDELYARNYRLNKRLIREMSEWCDARGVRFLLVCGSSVYEPEEIAEYRAADASFDADYFENDLASFADSLGVEYLGLQSVFRAHVEGGGGPLNWGHLNYHGHRVVARALVTKLEQMLADAQVSQDG